MKSVGILALSVLAGASSSALAVITYPDMNATNVLFQNLSEDSTTNPGVPLFGSGTINTAGDSLVLNPANFGATSTNGGPAAATQGTLNVDIQAKPGFFIPAINFAEAGDFTILGGGGLGTAVSVTASIQITVTEVNGGAIAPISFSTALNFFPSGGTFNLLDDGQNNVTIWNGNQTYDINGFLAGNGIFGQATRVTVELSNNLTATSEFGTIAFIKKKEVDGSAITVVPAPGAVALLGLGGLVAARRRRA